MQLPGSGTEVAAGTTVTAEINVGPATERIPKDLVGRRCRRGGRGAHRGGLQQCHRRSGGRPARRRRDRRGGRVDPGEGREGGSRGRHHGELRRARGPETDHRDAAEVGREQESPAVGDRGVRREVGGESVRGVQPAGRGHLQRGAVRGSVRELRAGDRRTPSPRSPSRPEPPRPVAGRRPRRRRRSRRSGSPRCRRSVSTRPKPACRPPARPPMQTLQAGSLGPWLPLRRSRTRDSGSACPAEGHGSLATWRARIAALLLDWAVCMGVAVLLFGPG